MPILFKPPRFSDDRGWFSETYHAERYRTAGLDVEFVQDNQSYSKAVGTLRGLHFQAPPHAQGKLVRVLRGRILDVAVDIRVGSPTYGQWISAELSAADGHQLYVPVGYAHGFATLEPDTEVLYKVTDYYDKASEGGIVWNCPRIGVEWGLGTTAAVLSPKDEVLPHLDDLSSPFLFDGKPMRLEVIG